MLSALVLFIMLRRVLSVLTGFRGDQAPVPGLGFIKVDSVGFKVVRSSWFDS